MKPLGTFILSLHFSAFYFLAKPFLVLWFVTLRSVTYCADQSLNEKYISLSFSSLAKSASIPTRSEVNFPGKLRGGEKKNILCHYHLVSMVYTSSTMALDQAAREKSLFHCKIWNSAISRGDTWTQVENHYLYKPWNFVAVLLWSRSPLGMVYTARRLHLDCTFPRDTEDNHQRLCCSTSQQDSVLQRQRKGK